MRRQRGRRPCRADPIPHVSTHTARHGGIVPFTDSEVEAWRLLPGGCRVQISVWVHPQHHDLCRQYPFVACTLGTADPARYTWQVVTRARGVLGQQRFRGLSGSGPDHTCTRTHTGTHTGTHTHTRRHTRTRAHGHVPRAQPPSGLRPPALLRSSGAVCGRCGQRQDPEDNHGRSIPHPQPAGTRTGLASTRPHTGALERPGSAGAASRGGGGNASPRGPLQAHSASACNAFSINLSLRETRSISHRAQHVTTKPLHY